MRPVRSYQAITGRLILIRMLLPLSGVTIILLPRSCTSFSPPSPPSSDDSAGVVILDVLLVLDDSPSDWLDE